MSDFQKKWETYKGYRIEPSVITNIIDPKDKLVVSVYISSAIDGKLVMPKINVEGYFESEEDAYRAAVECGKKKIDSMELGSAESKE